MPDPYSTIAEADRILQERLSDILELRASDPQQQAMLRAYLSEIELPPGSRALEVGCGTGAVSRTLVESMKLEVTGVDPSPVFVARARALASHLPGVTFVQGDGRSLTFGDASFDLVVFHTTLCHVPEPERALDEAYRVLRPDGWLAVFDGDYTTATVAVAESDPLQPLVDEMVRNFVHDPWLTRRLAKTLVRAGFGVRSIRTHGYLQTAEPTYMLTLVDRGADILATSGAIGAGTSETLKMESRRRVEAGEFFGQISFISAIARKPSRP